MNFAFLDIDMFKQLSVVMVRPHLEYGTTVWNPRFNKTALRVGYYSMELSLQETNNAN